MVQAFKLPDLGEGIHEGEVLKVLVSVGDRVVEGDLILEVETDKAAVEIPSPYTGTVEAIRVAAGDVVHVGDILMTFTAADQSDTDTQTHADAAPVEASASPVDRDPGSPAVRTKEPVPASPATRRLARELAVDLASVPPTGPGGLVLADDVKRYAAHRSPVPPAPETPAATPETPLRPLTAEAPVLPDFKRWGPVERVPLKSIRRATAKQMALAWSQIPHVANQDMVDLTRIDALRRKHKTAVATKGGRLTLTVFALKAAVAALKAFPRFNASLDAAAGEIVLKSYYHIGVAVNAEKGLVVPVIRDVDRKSITELAIELDDLVQRARTHKTAIEEMQGGTFTITNAGPMGGGTFTPIINFPEAAILGMGQARHQPVVLQRGNGRMEIVPRLMMPVVICVDHRVLDGADAIAFLRVIINALEDPEELLMTGI